ncbi:MAG TPA: delta-60 repeat domain-containing protein, partial [Flavobacteriales bacterium]|nr:delta-60 repeat domain-containing protein [Flavobacteriales bacterium]
MRTRYAITLTALATSALGTAQPTPLTRQLDWWVANGTVRTIEADQTNELAYLGGDFSEMLPPASTQYGCLLESTGEGWPVLRSPDPVPSVWFDHVRPNNTVRAVVSDGIGGWYIGGDFTQVNSQPRLRLAHILADGSLDPNWQSGTDGIIRALCLHNGKLYVGGDFSNASLVRNRIAAFNAEIGSADYSNLDLAFNSLGQANNNQVRVIVASGDLLYVGGTFTSMAGATCNRLIALDGTTGQSTSWVPNANGEVNAIVLTNNTAMVGGSFTQVNSTGRNRFAEIDLTSGALTTLNPGSNGTIWSLALSGDTVFAGGEFTNFYGQSRSRLAALKLLPTPAILNWNPAPDNSVITMLVEQDHVKIGGTFGNVGTTSQVRYRLAAVSRSTGEADLWNPFSNGSVLALAKHSTGIYAGGSFTTVGYRLRNRLAAIDLTTGKPTLFNPNVNNTVYDIELHAGNIYIGGAFSSVGGQTRNRAAALDVTGTPLALWQPNINNTVYALAKDGTLLYLGGSFSTISGFTRNRIAGLDLATGAVSTTWAPTADGDVMTMAVNNGSLYAGGAFTTIGNPAQPRQRIARLGLGSENPDSWNPGASGTVRCFAFKNNDNRVFVGGQFLNIGGASRNYLAALDANANGAVSDWVCNANSFVYALCLSGNT